jgi:hypothetical protein
MAVRNAQQLLWRRRVESGIRLVAPLLDVVLVVGDRVSRIAGRNDFEPDPPRHSRTPIGGSPDEARPRIDRSSA